MITKVITVKIVDCGVRQNIIAKIYQIKFEELNGIYS